MNRFLTLASLVFGFAALSATAKADSYPGREYEDRDYVRHVERSYVYEEAPRYYERCLPPRVVYVEPEYCVRRPVAPVYVSPPPVVCYRHHPRFSFFFGY